MDGLETQFIMKILECRYAISSLEFLWGYRHCFLLNGDIIIQIFFGFPNNGFDIDYRLFEFVIVNDSGRGGINIVVIFNDDHLCKVKT